MAERKKTGGAARKRPARKRSGAKPAAARRPFWRRALRGAAFGGASLVAIWLVFVVAYRFVPVPTTMTMLSEAWARDRIEKDWVSMDEIAPVMARAAVAAEDARFCLHWGFDMTAIREALEDGANRGASTISQQTVKNVFLWQGRSWVRKALEALMTPVVEALWPKRRILEVYLNVAEFDTGVFGIEAAAQHHFGVSAADLSPRQAALLAAVLPNPRGWAAVPPSAPVARRAPMIADGAEVIRRDGRADCFERE